MFTLSNVDLCQFIITPQSNFLSENLYTFVINFNILIIITLLINFSSAKASAGWLRLISSHPPQQESLWGRKIELDIPDMYNKSITDETSQTRTPKEGSQPEIPQNQIAITT